MKRAQLVRPPFHRLADVATRLGIEVDAILLMAGNDECQVCADLSSIDTSSTSVRVDHAGACPDAMVQPTGWPTELPFPRWAARCAKPMPPRVFQILPVHARRLPVRPGRSFRLKHAVRFDEQGSWALNFWGADGSGVEIQFEDLCMLSAEVDRIAKSAAAAAAPAAASPQAPVKRQKALDRNIEAILGALAAKGLDPMALPAYTNGLEDPSRAAARSALPAITDSAFERAWLALPKAYAKPPN